LAPDEGTVSRAADVRLAARESIRAIQLVRAYRVIGHLAADLDPLNLLNKPPLPQLDPHFYGFRDADLDHPVFINGVLGLESATPRQMSTSSSAPIAAASATSSLHINDAEQKDWLQRRIEGRTRRFPSLRKAKRSILFKLVEAEGFEKFCAVRFVGTKRFGLDGGEAMIPALEQIIKRGGQLGVKEIVLGMSHRGR